jgi:hypothetical protein
MIKALVLRLAALFLCVIPLVGCWTAKDQVFSASEAERLPGIVYLEQKGATDDIGKPMRLSLVDNSNDYAFSVEGLGPPGCAGNKGTFRAIHIRNDIYVLQILCKEGYNLQFYSIASGRYHTVGPAETINDRDARLARYRVKFGDSQELLGTSSDINAYLRSFKDAEFQPSGY